MEVMRTDSPTIQFAVYAQRPDDEFDPFATPQPSATMNVDSSPLSSMTNSSPDVRKKGRLAVSQDAPLRSRLKTLQSRWIDGRRLIETGGVEGRRDGLGGMKLLGGMACGAARKRAAEGSSDCGLDGGRVAQPTQLIHTPWSYDAATKRQTAIAEGKIKLTEQGTLCEEETLDSKGLKEKKRKKVEQPRGDIADDVEDDMKEDTSKYINWTTNDGKMNEKTPDENIVLW
ncbi:hypothetical protein BYT27DRAFT_7218283 [Phlegmacium glaucopus]|nr:hypothetical protein BYT27DRAFT_7218283 [Phlegmacium glaucopus]